MKCKRCKRDLPDNSVYCCWCGAKQIKDRSAELTIPKPQQMTSGNWFIRLRLGGENINITEPTEAACRAKARAIKAGFIEAKGTVKKITLSEALQNYIAAKEGVLSPSTIRGYLCIAKTRFLSYQNKDVNKLTSCDWQRMVSEEAALAGAKTVKNAWLFAKSALKMHGVAVDAVTLPQITKQERNWLTPEQIPIFLDAAVGAKCEIAALLGLHSLRRSEILAVTGRDINLIAKTINVNGAVVLDKDNNVITKATNKTKGSNRIVPIMIPRLYDLLKASKFKPTESIVKVTHPNALYKAVNKVCRQAALPEVGVHGLRHTFASLAYSIGLSELETQRIGGWANSAIVHEIYTHLSEKDRVSAENKMKEFYVNLKNVN